MIKKLYNYIKMVKGGASLPPYQDVAQGFDTSLKSVLQGSISDTNQVNQNLKGHDENDVMNVYNDELDFETQYQRKFVENIVEHNKQVNGHYEVENNVKSVENQEITNNNENMQNKNEN